MVGQLADEDDREHEAEVQKAEEKMKIEKKLKCRRHHQRQAATTTKTSRGSRGGGKRRRGSKESATKPRDQNNEKSYDFFLITRFSSELGFGPLGPFFFGRGFSASAGTSVAAATFSDSSFETPICLNSICKLNQRLTSVDVS